MIQSLFYQSAKHQFSSHIIIIILLKVPLKDLSKFIEEQRKAAETMRMKASQDENEDEEENDDEDIQAKELRFEMQYMRIYLI